MSRPDTAWIVIIVGISIMVLLAGCQEFSKEYGYSPIPSDFNSSSY